MALDIKKLDWVFFRRLIMYIGSIVLAVGATWFLFMGGLSAFILDAEGFVIHDMTTVSTSYEGELKEIYVKPGEYVQKRQLVGLMTSTKIHEQLMNIQSQYEQSKYNGPFNIQTGGDSSPARLLDFVNRYRKLVEIYDNGKIYANADGHVGTTIAHVGQVIHPGDPIIRVFQGHSYVIAYVADNHIFDVKEGEPVSIYAAGHKAKGYIEKILPINEPLPKQIQHPHTYERRGHTIRILFTDEDPFPIDQHVYVSYCSKWLRC